MGESHAHSNNLVELFVEVYCTYSSILHVRNKLFTFRSDAFLIKGDKNFKSGINFFLENNSIPFTSEVVLCRLITKVQRLRFIQHLCSMFLKWLIYPVFVHTFVYFFIPYCSYYVDLCLRLEILKEMHPLLHHLKVSQFM